MGGNEIEQDIDEAVNNLEKKLQIRSGFFDSLYQEDDWSFIIKAHAIIEASVSSLITEYFGEEKLIEIFSRIELSNKSYGKIIFLKHLNFLDKEERRFISSLSEIRNKLVHNIKEIDFSIKTFVDSLNKSKKQSFIDSFGYYYLIEDKNCTRKVEKYNQILSDPKKTIWLSLKYILAILSLQIETIKYRQEADKQKKEINKQWQEIERLQSELRALQNQKLDNTIKT